MMRAEIFIGNETMQYMSSHCSSVMCDPYVRFLASMERRAHPSQVGQRRWDIRPSLKLYQAKYKSRFVNSPRCTNSSTSPSINPCTYAGPTTRSVSPTSLAA